MFDYRFDKDAMKEQKREMVYALDIKKRICGGYYKVVDVQL